MPEGLRELLELVLTWSFAPLAAALLLVGVVGSGAWSPRWRRATWALGLALLAATLYLGVARHEWGEVLFNGQLL